MTGAELAALRRAMGLSQSDLARRSGISRQSVSYWENRPEIDGNARAVRCMAVALGPPQGAALLASRLVSRPQSVRIVNPTYEQLKALLALAQLRRQEAAAEKQKVRCGAKTRQGTPCRRYPEAGKTRCLLHGARSSGPKTAEGRTRIAQAQRERWRRWRQSRQMM